MFCLGTDRTSDPQIKLGNCSCEPHHARDLTEAVGGLDATRSGRCFQASRLINVAAWIS